MFTAEGFVDMNPMKYFGDIELPEGFSVHVRGLMGYEPDTWQDGLDALAPLKNSDIFVVNFGAHHLEKGMEEYRKIISEVILNELTRLPGTVIWREYSPAHFGGPTGEYVATEKALNCSPASVGELYTNEVPKHVLMECGERCKHVKWLPVHSVSLARYGAHTGQHISKTKRGIWNANILDCRHFCLNVLGLWNEILFSMLCSSKKSRPKEVTHHENGTYRLHRPLRLVGPVGREFVEKAMPN